MPLTTYEEVRPWARAIKEQVLTRRMPKWHAARGFGAFANDPTLTSLESTMLVSWIDGGLPEGPAASRVLRARSIGFMRKTDRLVPLAPLATEVNRRVTPLWVTGWMFEPGDPLITSATIESTSGPLITWVAGDAPVVLPPDSALPIGGPLHVVLQRRNAADFEARFTPKRSLLRLRISESPPARRIFIERVACNAPREQALATSLIAIRPVLGAKASVRVWLQRPGAPASILGWFREFEPGFARTYWLARPVELSPDARLHADGPCTLEVIVQRR